MVARYSDADWAGNADDKKYLRRMLENKIWLLINYVCVNSVQKNIKYGI